MKPEPWYLPVVAQTADVIAVMQAGQIVEQGSASSVMSAPQHPYTRRLLDSMPDLADLEGAHR